MVFGVGGSDFGFYFVNPQFGFDARFSGSFEYIEDPLPMSMFRFLYLG